MPSPRVICVVLLVGMGALVASAGSGGTVAGEPVLTVARLGVVGSPTSASPTSASATAAPSPDSPKAVPGPASFDVRAENRRSGSRDWRINRSAGEAAGLDAFAGATSVESGQSVPLFVSAEGTVKIRAFRIGWYGGAGARLAWSGTLRAAPQLTDSRAWQARGWADTTGWAEGHYLLRLDAGRASRYLPLTVRSRDARGAVVLVTSPMTWAAENDWQPTPGSLTQGLQSRRIGGPYNVAPGRGGSLQKPYAAGYGSGGFLADEAGIVQQAERDGRRLAYFTDTDLANSTGVATSTGSATTTAPAPVTSLLSGAAAVVMGGSRYWTRQLGAAVARAQAAGTNLAAFGTATGSWQASLEDRGLEVLVPVAEQSVSVRLTGTRPSCPIPASTIASGAVPPVASRTTPAVTGWSVTSGTWWGYEGTGVRSGQVLPGLVGGGSDRAATSSAGSPDDVQALSFATLTCAGQPTAQSGVYAVRASGAGVFAAATGRWACVVANTCVNARGGRVEVDPRTRAFAVRVTRNVLRGFSKPAAGKRHPAKNTAGQYVSLTR